MSMAMWDVSLAWLFSHATAEKLTANITATANTLAGRTTASAAATGFGWVGGIETTRSGV